MGVSLMRIVLFVAAIDSSLSFTTPGKLQYLKHQDRATVLREEWRDEAALWKDEASLQTLTKAVTRTMKRTVTRSVTQTMLPLMILSLSAFSPVPAAAASATSTTKIDGFASYAAEKKMEQSDVGCFLTRCGKQTANLFSSPRGIQGITCLGQCKGEQSCATSCFAEFGSNDLDEFLGCAVEREGCVKVPRDVEEVQEKSENDPGRLAGVKFFDGRGLEGTWYKTDGLNPNYDLFPCQSNTFGPMNDQGEIDMDIKFNVRRPGGGGFYSNQLVEKMKIDEEGAVGGRTMHTGGKMYGLTFSENWWIVGESDGKSTSPYKLVAYKGHTLQGGYEGAFVYAKTPSLDDNLRDEIAKKYAQVGLNFDDFTKIDNACPAEGKVTNDDRVEANWFDLVVGEGGIIDWVVPGWRGEYESK